MLSGAIDATVLNITSISATSTFANGIQLSGGCFRMANGNCAITGSAGGTFNTGLANSLSYYSAPNTIDSANFLATNVTQGLFGVGTSSPSGRLSVEGSRLLPSATPLFIIASSTPNSATSTVFLISSAGNLGLGGTTSPAAFFSIHGTSTQPIVMVSTSTPAFATST